MALQLVITNAGRAAVIDQANGGFRAVRIAAVGVSPTAINAAPTSANLPDEVKRIASIAGEATATDVTHLTVTDESADSYTVRSFALYLSDGTLFALYGQGDPIVQKSAQALLLLAIDVALSNIPAAAITFGSANFTNPAATTERAGVVELANDTEIDEGTDGQKAVTPRSLRRAYAALAGATFTGAVAIRQALLPTLTFIRDGVAAWSLGGLGTTANTFALRLNAAVAWSVDSALNTRLGGSLALRGQNDAIYPSITLERADGRWLLGGASSGTSNFQLRLNDTLMLDVASSGDVSVPFGSLKAPGGVYADQYCYLTVPVPSIADVSFDTGDVLRYTRNINQYDFLIGSNSALSITAGQLYRAGNRVWDAANDGAGSGLDADLLDGRHASGFLVRGEGSRPLDYDYGAGTMTIRADTGGWALAYAFQTSDGSPLGGFGALGGGNALPTYYYVGQAHNASNNLRIYPTRVSYGDNTIWHAGNDGAGSGLDADLLDGRQAADFALLTGATFVGAIAASRFAIDDNCYLMIPAPGLADLSFDAGDVLRYTRAQNRYDFLINSNSIFSISAGGAEVAGNKVWTAANDGAGSGLDADLVDGWHRDDIRDWNNLLNKPAAFPVAAHTHGAADIAGAFPASLSGNGYVVLPNGLILQWVTGAQQAASSEGTQYVAFPIAFNTCFQVITSTQVANPNIESHAIYQLISFAAEGATVMRQLVSASGADREPSWPRLFAIGR